MLAGLLERPDDPASWLVLSDWLEEQGDPASLARAGLLRLRPRWAGAADDPERQAEVAAEARTILDAQPELLGDFQPLVARGFRVLSEPAALVLFLLADHASPGKAPAARTTWEGELEQ